MHPTCLFRYPLLHPQDRKIQISTAHRNSVLVESCRESKEIVTQGTGRKSGALIYFCSLCSKFSPGNKERNIWALGFVQDTTAFSSQRSPRGRRKEWELCEPWVCTRSSKQNLKGNLACIKKGEGQAFTVQAAQVVGNLLRNAQRNTKVALVCHPGPQACQISQAAQDWACLVLGCKPAKESPGAAGAGYGVGTPLVSVVCKAGMALGAAAHCMRCQL